MQRAKWAAHFTVFGTLYSTGYEAEEVRLIKRELRRMGIPVGGTRLDKAPRQLEPHELGADDTEPDPRDSQPLLFRCYQAKR